MRESEGQGGVFCAVFRSAITHRHPLSLSVRQRGTFAHPTARRSCRRSRRSWTARCALAGRARRASPEIRERLTAYVYTLAAQIAETLAGRSEKAALGIVAMTIGAVTQAHAYGYCRRRARTGRAAWLAGEIAAMALMLSGVALALRCKRPAQQAVG